ncbi:diguanylate cyclase domain-containing protein [Salinicola rhizosphaerae]|uniref:GGDEF domain-containing protein n=1 Tax=Salinicola rhizosphaerae TaxID=1443141 RepID=A0ABQ3DUY3_9GAMM|nr:diguanylate cyclase [Salinicola rhizosphaerae]GHB10896.1 hypothetical protein GCM10009038_05930 [Salinicola rhizosphaerae]
MALSRYKIAAQLLTLLLFATLATWHYLMRQYDLILPPSLLAIALAISIPLQWVGRLRPALADYLLLIGALVLFAIEAPRSDQGMIWVGLPTVLSVLLLSPALALLLNLCLVPAWLTLLGGLHLTLLNLSIGWWVVVMASLLVFQFQSRAGAVERSSASARRPRVLSPDCVRQNLDIEIARAHAMRRPLSALVVYIPQLDQASDQFGSQLRELLSDAFGELISHNSRQSDLFGAYGDNVFCLILPNSGEPGAVAAAKRLANAVTTISRPETGPLESQSRVCTLKQGEEAAQFLRRLDVAAHKLLEPHA